MRHLKTFEGYGYYAKEDGDLEEGDYVVLLKHNKETKNEKFTVGNVYHITLTDYGDRNPYEISKIKEEGGVWVKEEQVRKATEFEIATIKYNL